MTLAGAARRIARRQPPRAVILLYHRVAAPHVDPFRLAVSPERFQQQLELVRSRYRVTTLDELVAELDGPAAAEPSVAVTFDDGYADNLELAAPIAGALGIPLTVFVTVRPVLSGTLFWWDELAELVSRPGRSEPLVVRAAGRKRRFRTRSHDERLRACVDLHRLLRRMPDSRRRDVLDELEAARPNGGRPISGRALTVDELQSLDRLPGVTIGSHTISHPALTSLTRSEREAEIAGSRLSLEDLLGHPVDHFSYPYGRGADIDSETVRMAGTAGYRAACTTVQVAVSQRSRPHALPRLTVLDWTPAEFTRALAKHLPPR